MTHSHPAPSSIRDDSICESSLHPNKSSGDIGERLRDELLKWWSFDERQHHTHSWHTRTDFIYTELPKIVAPFAAEIERLRRELDAANSNHRSMAHQLAETGIRLEAIKRERDELYQANIEWARGNLVNAREKIAMECHALTAESAAAAAWEEAAKIAETFFFNDIGKLQVGPSIQDGIASAIRAAGAERNSTHKGRSRMNEDARTELEKEIIKSALAHDGRYYLQRRYGRGPNPHYDACASLVGRKEATWLVSTGPGIQLQREYSVSELM